MYEDDSYALLVKTGPFGISWPVLCSYWVVGKFRSQKVEVTGGDKAYLLSTIQRYLEYGGAVQKLRTTDLFPRFCEAMSHRNGAAGDFFFSSETPETRAKSLFNTTQS